MGYLFFLWMIFVMIPIMIRYRGHPDARAPLKDDGIPIALAVAIVCFVVAVAAQYLRALR